MAVTANYGFTKPTVAADSGIWGGSLNTDLDSIDLVLAVPKINWTSPTYNVGGTTTCDCGIARVFAFTVSGASTLAFSNVPSASFDAKVALLITNGSAFALTFPASVTWLSGVAPTFKTAGVDIVDLETKDAGVTWYAMVRADRRFQVGTSTAGAGTTRTLFKDTNKTTTSTSDVSLSAFSLPGNSLSADGMALRVTAWGRVTTQAGSVNLKFGATVLQTVTPAVGGLFYFTYMISRTGAATQVGTGFAIANAGAGTPNFNRNGMTETLSGAITIDLRGSVTSGGTLTLDGYTIEFLDS